MLKRVVPAGSERPARILCVMRMPPDLNGHGGSQRAWHLLRALQGFGEVHFVLLYRDVDADCVGVPLAHLAEYAATVTAICIPAWNPAGVRKLAIFHPWLVDLLRMRSQVAPKLGRRVLAQIAARLPLRNPDVIFGCRLETATIIEDLIEAGMLKAVPRVVDFDDISSRFKLRQIESMGPQWGWQGPWLARAEVKFIEHAEDRIARSWRALSVCTDEDVQALRARYPEQQVAKLVNVIVRERLPARPADGRFRILFAGNLRFHANIDGLQKFVEVGWPTLAVAIPEAELVIVGMNPLPEVVEMARFYGFALHANVPEMRPYYEDCDVVIAPILFGSGTRIKILEAMAYGRAIVSTTLGAEGLDVANGRELLLVDTMVAFAEALIRLACDPVLADALVERAHAHQARNFGLPALEDSLTALLAPVLAEADT